MDSKDERLLTEREASAYLSISIGTLGNWRSVGRGPLYHKIGGRAVRYSMSDLRDFVNDSRVAVEG